MWSSLQLSLEHHWDCKAPGLRMTYLHGIFSFNILYTYFIIHNLLWNYWLFCLFFMKIFNDFFTVPISRIQTWATNKMIKKNWGSKICCVKYDEKEMSETGFVKERIILFFKINLAWQKPKVYRFSHIISLTLLRFLTISVNHILRKVETDWALSYFFGVKFILQQMICNVLEFIFINFIFVTKQFTNKKNW